jgi:hypothetical protein
MEQRALQPVDRDEVEEGEAERFVLTTPGRYVVYIWLRPRTIVLHWTVGPYGGGAAARRSYHFLVDDGGTWIPAGRTDRGAEMRPSWRMWWHNLRLLGVPNLRRRQGVDLRLNRREAGGSFGGANNVIGYFVHAQGFHLNTAAVAFTGMRGAPDVWGSTSWGYQVEENGREVTRWQSRDAGQRWQPLDADGEPIQTTGRSCNGSSIRRKRFPITGIRLWMRAGSSAGDHRIPPPSRNFRS